MQASVEPPEHEGWLLRTTDIRSALNSLTHPASLVQARDSVGMQWIVKVLGLDSRSRLFFWRPDSGMARQADGLADRLASAPLDFTATAYDGSWLQFQAGQPALVRFDDGSLLMVSPFPARLRHEFNPG
ncbi:hypothetical protein [Bordetella genomosp. 13]|uniref:hypothetical protein n=1 Tax=Bordetella genomosp. 13 TaxID=463040 RepID=UPI0012F85272|nr:hypothetical protein [Bordetella genomosp. 13]